jgi:hypothetical protein
VIELIGFVGGPLLEEFGWRGFALPRLQGKLRPLAGTLILLRLSGLARPAVNDTGLGRPDWRLQPCRGHGLHDAKEAAAEAAKITRDTLAASATALPLAERTSLIDQLLAEYASGEGHGWVSSGKRRARAQAASAAMVLRTPFSSGKDSDQAAATGIGHPCSCS